MPSYLRYAGLRRAPRKRVISLVAAGAVVTGVIVSGTPGRASAATAQHRLRLLLTHTVRQRPGTFGN